MTVATRGYSGARTPTPAPEGRNLCRISAETLPELRQERHLRGQGANAYCRPASTALIQRRGAELHHRNCHRANQKDFDLPAAAIQIHDGADSREADWSGTPFPVPLSPPPPPPMPPRGASLPEPILWRPSG